MRVTPLLLFLLTVPVSRPSLSQTAAANPAPQDVQAVSVLNQAVAVGGGLTPITAIADYIGSGNITYHWTQDVQGSVTIRGLGLVEFRLDANLPSGVRSLAVQGGKTTTKAEDGTISQIPAPYPVPSSDAFPYQPPMFPGSLAVPHAQIAAVLNNPQFIISDKGVIQIDGHSVHDIQVQLAPPWQAQPDSMAEYHTRDFFIDTSTLQLVMTQDNVPKHIVHQIRYAGYTAVNGVLVPFSIGEQMGGQHTWEIQLSQISFNSGLQDSAFVLQ